MNAPHELNGDDARYIQGLTRELEKMLLELTTYHLTSAQVSSMWGTFEALTAGLRAIRGRCDLIVGRSEAFGRELARLEQVKRGGDVKP